MKKLVVLLAVGLLTISSSFSAVNPELVREIESKVFVDLSQIELDEYNQDYVMVSFKIIDHEIKIQEINSTNSELKSKIIDELYEMRIDSDYNSRETYMYKFTFEKV